MGLIFRKNIGIIFFNIVVVSMLTAHFASAAWTGPNEIVSGVWGSGNDQFGIVYEDASEMFADISITSEGKIIVRDGLNGRLKIFNLLGGLESVIPYRLNLHATELTTADMFGFTGYFIGYGINNTDYYFRADQKKYIKYSSTGQLLQTYTERPLELGLITEKKLAPDQYKVTVKYPDKEWGMAGKGRFPGYMRDLNGNLYGTGETQVARFNDCGKELSRMTMPKTKVDEREASFDWGDLEPPPPKVLEEYGSPVLAPNGDVYAWKRTPDKYSIIKWTWQDDPNPPANTPDAPMNFKVIPWATGLMLTWQLSPQDPGCVANYEIVRSEVAGGPYSALTTVSKGLMKYEDITAEAGKTYYYKIRAKGGIGYSDYSSEVAGTR